jgi:hypothetical protein
MSSAAAGRCCSPMNSARSGLGHATAMEPAGTGRSLWQLRRPQAGRLRRRPLRPVLRLGTATRPRNPVRPRDGRLFVERDGVSYVLLLLELKSPAFSMETQRQVAAAGPGATISADPCQPGPHRRGSPACSSRQRAGQP